MAKFSARSEERLQTCHADLRGLFREVVRYWDCAILCGHRSQEDQDAAYTRGSSKLRYPHGKHNALPSLAVDVAPWPIDWRDLQRFHYFAGFVLGTAAQLGIRIRWGGDWDSDRVLIDESFRDLVHFEVKPLVPMSDHEMVTEV